MLMAGLLWGDSFTVESRNGVPFITRNGVPVPARMFWGNVYGQKSSAPIDAKWKQITLTFRSLIDCDHAALHLRFGDPPEEGRIEVKDLEMVRLDSPERRRPGSAGKSEGDVVFWCAGIRENPPVSLRLSSPGNLQLELGRAPALLKGFHLLWRQLSVKRGGRYEIRFQVRSDQPRTISPTVHRQGGDFMKLGGLAQRNLFAEQLKQAADSGVQFVTFSIFGIWQKPGTSPDYSALQHACDMILKAHPGARLIPRIDLRFPPEWWAACHPDELMKFKPDLQNNYPSTASKLYLREAADALRRVIRFCEQRYPEHMAGYHITGGNTQEWFYYQVANPALSGYDRRTDEAWREFSGAASAAGAVPSPERRRTDGKHLFLHPGKDREVLAFREFRQKLMVDSLLHLARVVRSEVGRTRLCLTFYGYLFEFSSMGNGPGETGHYLLERLLDSPDIDIICSPLSYRDRQYGGGGAIMTPAESITRAGKLYLLEDDTSTHIATASGNTFAGHESGVTHPQETIQLLRRNLMLTLSRNAGFWWMDLQGAGWFNDSALWKQQEFFRDWMNRNMQHPTPYRPEIGVFLDEKSMCAITGPGMTDCTTTPLIAQGRADWNRIGAPYGQYLLRDLPAVTDGTKLHIVAGAYALHRDERVALNNVLAGKAVIWAYAPGFLDLDRGEFSTGAVQEVCGFQVQLQEDVSFRVTATPAGRSLGLPEHFGPERQLHPVSPVLAVVPASGDSVLAVYSNGTPAVVLRGKQLFCGTTRIPVALYRAMAEIGGCHLYTGEEAAVYANNGYLGVCAVRDGSLHVKFPAAVKTVLEKFSGRSFEAGALTFPVKKGECLLFLENPPR